MLLTITCRSICVNRLSPLLFCLQSSQMLRLVLSDMAAMLRLLTVLAILGVVASAAARISRNHSSSWSSVGQGVDGELDIRILVGLAAVVIGILE